MLEDATDVYGGRCTVEFGDATAITPQGNIIVDTEPEYFKSLSPVNQFRLVWDGVCHEKWHDKMSDLNGKGDFAQRMDQEHPDSHTAGAVGGQIWNVVEDAYIDHQRGEENPGMRTSIAMLEDAVVGDDRLNPPMGDVPPSNQRQAGLVQLLRGGRVKGFKDATPAAQDYLTWAKVKIDEAKTAHEQDYRTDLAETLTRRLLEEVDEPDPPDDPDDEPDHPDEGDGDSGETEGEQESGDGDDDDQSDEDDSQPSDDPQEDDDEPDEGDDDDGQGSGDDEGDDESDDDGDESGSGDGDDDDDSTHEDDDEGDDAAADEGDDGDAAENDDEDGDESGGDDAGDESGDGDDEDQSDEDKAREDLEDYDDDPDAAMDDRHGCTPEDAYEANDVDRSQYQALKRRENLPDDSAEKRAQDRDDKVDESNSNIGSRTMTDETKDMADDVAAEFQRVRTRTRTTPAEDGDSIHFDNAMRRRMGDMSVDRYHTKTERMEAGGRAIGVALDCSGSMGSGFGPSLIKPARMALVALAEAAETLGDDFMATTFHTVEDQSDPHLHRSTDDGFDNSKAPGKANIKFDDEAIIQDVITRAGEPFEPEHLEVTDIGGGTPTGLGVMDITYLLGQSSRDEKLAIVLTDGMASTTNDGWHCTMGNMQEATQDAIDAVEDARARGIKVIGVGIGDVEDQYLSDVFGDGRYVSASRDDMAEDLVSLYRDELNVRM